MQQMSTHETRYLTVAEAAARLRVSRPTVWRWIDSGRLPAYRIGARSIRIREEDIDKVVEPTPTGMRRIEDEPGSWSYQMGDPALSADEIDRRLREVRERILSRRGGKPFESSVEIIRRGREGR